MASIQELKKNVEIKIKTLDLVVRENERILQRNKEKELQKHLLIYENRQEEIYDLKYQIQKPMISEESTMDEFEELPDQLEESVRRSEEPMTIIQDSINQWKEKNAIESRKEEESKFARKIEKEKKIEEMRQELQRSIRVSGDQPKEQNVKLPKLVISPFTGTHNEFF